MRSVKNLLIIFLGAILLSCSSTRSISILYSDSYDETKDQTSVMILPFGTVKVQGQWKKVKENHVSGQYFFDGPDSVGIAIALQPWDRYEFSHNNPEVTPQNFVRKFYEWDANYLKEKTGGQLRIVKEDEQKGYLIWSLSNGPIPQDYFLFGLKGNIAYNLEII
ncbi:MAG: hypothetical protein HOP08_03380 [Cyclobacteriaceae bacterium]|nr:hypothetical protein [Cyclobacteriaceae bacterium]